MYFVQFELGDIVFVEFFEVGVEIKVDELFGSVEFVKMVFEFYVLINGIVVEVNEDFDDSLEFVNEFLYEKVWMIVVELFDVFEIEKLMIVEQYEEMI